MFLPPPANIQRKELTVCRFTRPAMGAKLNREKSRRPHLLLIFILARRGASPWSLPAIRNGLTSPSQSTSNLHRKRPSGNIIIWSANPLIALTSACANKKDVRPPCLCNFSSFISVYPKINSRFLYIFTDRVKTEQAKRKSRRRIT